MRIYLKEIEKIPLLTADQERELSRRVRKGDMEARELMIKSNLRLVISIAKEFIGRGLSFMDLIEEGNIGLVKGVERFDPEEGNRFSTYGTWWIKQTIRRALVNTVKTVRVPSYMIELIARFRQERDRLLHKRGVPPTLYEVAEVMELKPDTIEMLRRALNTTLPTSELMIDDEGSESDALKDENAEDPLDTALTNDELLLIQGMLNSITEREADILRKRYGIGNERPMTLKEIGESIGLTRERVRQIENEALRKLHFALVQKHGGRIAP